MSYFHSFILRMQCSVEQNFKRIDKFYDKIGIYAGVETERGIEKTISLQLHWKMFMNCKTEAQSSRTDLKFSV